jgi:hypothetical protein
MEDERAAPGSTFRHGGFQRRPSGNLYVMFRPSFLGLVYLIVGVAVAAANEYFEKLNTLRLLLSALLAVLLWPLVLLGIDLHIKK